MNTLGPLVALGATPATSISPPSNLHRWEWHHHSWLKQQFIAWFARTIGWLAEIVCRVAHLRGFQVLPKRWSVERTFAWFNPYRRLSKDYEYYPSSSEVMIYLASIRLMLRRVTKRPTQSD